ncbi:adenylyl-sulfate kinase [Campylobacter sp. CNRCH_2014_0184h]|uniref:adenylyl-sulfate kinase n=1 Tax=Campylobacter sp. CNRCH_2014_0184h TaxID=2911602 RepID=UPI0021E69B36|nr:adenylyl-sulfate kinase [Campylobacter sp. CNRCH_2014_0184h]MCV3482451.1 adenylyl-sulfate kinase [Campylobacter sp. CNRCH_2014_0184h]
MQGVLVFITGLSGSGKTTLAYALQEYLQKEYHKKSIVLDGDELRACVENFEYTKNSRLKMAKYYIKLSQILYKQNFIVILSTISMFDEIRDYNRQNFARYLEIFLDVSLDIRKQRDSKNFFKQKITNIAGVDQTLEFPKTSDIVLKDNFQIQTNVKTIANIIDKLSIKENNE